MAMAPPFGLRTIISPAESTSGSSNRANSRGRHEQGHPRGFPTLNGRCVQDALVGPAAFAAVTDAIHNEGTA